MVQHGDGFGSRRFLFDFDAGMGLTTYLITPSATVTDLTNIPGSAAARQAMINGQIQAMWEYTGTGWITIQSSNLASLPVEGVRVSPSDAL